MPLKRRKDTRAPKSGRGQILENDHRVSPLSVSPPSGRAMCSEYRQLRDRSYCNGAPHASAMGLLTALQNTLTLTRPPDARPHCGSILTRPVLISCSCLAGFNASHASVCSAGTPPLNSAAQGGETWT